MIIHTSGKNENNELEKHIEFTSSSREKFLSDLSRCLENKNDRKKSVGAILLKIFSLRDINHIFGYREGDEFLYRLAGNLRKILKPDDLIFRASENEFLIALPNIMNEGHAILAATKLGKLFEKPVPIAGSFINIKPAMGIALFPEHAGTAEDLFKKSSMALDEAIKEGNPYAIWYDKQERLSDTSSLVVESHLKDAIEHNDLEMHYQPKLDIRNDTIFGVESLARWSHQEIGKVSPDYFIAVAEKSDLINELTASIINTTLKESCKWPGITANLSVSINLSTMNLLDETLVDIIQRAINVWDIDPGRLVFEVTESAMMTSPEQSLDILSRINSLGAQCSIDDFGTGYSSLVYLKKLPVTELKIDKSFIQNMPDDASDRMIANSIIDLAHNFNLSVTAEGVENEIILRELKGMNCDNAQGYYISRPMSTSALGEWLRNTRWKILKPEN